MTTAVVVALYNGEKFIEEQLDSLRNQQRAPERVVLCDDGSSDRTVEIVEGYIQRYELEKTWCLYINENNLGYIRNFYHAITLCNEDLIFLCDQDDVWELDKIAKMTEIMEQKQEIELLSCKYGIIDIEGKQIRSIMERNKKEDCSVLPISMEDVMRAYRWPGMVMCIRKQFFDEIYESIAEEPIPHDLALIVCATDKKGFYEYNYIGAHHRRHGNNVAREEHRIRKLLNLERKLKDITELCNALQVTMSANLPISEESKDLISYKLQLQEKRKNALQNRKLQEVFELYRKDYRKILRKVSFICDIWLIFFGKYR